MFLTCPSKAQLLLAALGDSHHGDEAIARHLTTCTSCLSEIAELRRMVVALDVTKESRTRAAGPCLDDEALAELADGVGEQLRPARVAHLAACAHCRVALASLVDLLATPEIVAERSRLTTVASAHRARRPSRIWIAGGGALAAAAAVLLMTTPGSRGDDQDAHRGPTITEAAAPVLLSPIGDVADARVLRWHRVSGAGRYRVTLFDAGGRALFEMQTTDTSIAVPDSVAIVPGRSYLWKIDARSAMDRWSSSGLMEFRIQRDSEPAQSSANAPTTATLVAFRAPSAAALLPRDSLRTLAPRLSDSALIGEARARPLELREALTATLARSLLGSATAQKNELLTAQRLASAYGSAWRDPFLSREVARFTAWSPERRASKVRGDATRRAGLSAFSRKGAPTAIAIWRRSLVLAAAIGDSAGLAATLGNIGAGFAYDDRPDSAERYLLRARAIAVAIGDLRVEANTLSELAGLFERRGNHAGARDRYGDALGLRERIGDRRGMASDYNNLAGLARATGDLVEARRLLSAALDINRRDGRPEVAATNLVNLAAIASLDGEFTRAVTAYREAAATWRALDRRSDVADAERGLGELELRRGDYAAARGHLRAALEIYESTGPLSEAILVRQALATTHAAQGDLQRALDELHATQRIADSARAAPGVRAGVALARADIGRQLNLHRQAAGLYTVAQSLFRSARDRNGLAEAQQGHGTLLLDQDDAAGAGAMLGAALRTQQSTGQRRSAALTRMLIAEVSVRRGDTLGARRELARAATELSRLGDPVSAAMAMGEQAALDLAASLPVVAESRYRAALAAIGTRTAPDVTWRLHAGLARVLGARGAVTERAAELRAAIADVERSAGSLVLPERRSSFLVDKWDVHSELALLEWERGRVGMAFQVSERMRASEMLGMLARGRVDAAPDATASLVGREQDLRRQIAELSRDAHPTEPAGRESRGPDASRMTEVRREALLAAQARYGEIRLEMRERAPRHAAIVAPPASTWRDVSRRLAPDEAFIEYLLGDSRALAFVVTRDTIVAVELPATRRDLASLVDFVRGTIEPRGSARLDSLWRAPLRQLHSDLVAPVEATGLLAKTRRLIVVPHGELHYLPFAALLGAGRGGRFLVERYELAMTPSASVWISLSTRATAARGSGVLAMAPRPSALPASRREVASISRLDGASARVLIGAEATESAFRREAPSRRVIHLATYGVLNKQNPLFSYVELVPGRADDGRLEVHEVFGLKLAADLVVLSACQTGLASGATTDVPAGDDWVGLARAFLSAGAGRVLATLWPVQDAATALLMDRFYERYSAGVAPARALAVAQRSLLAVPATASPYYWAGFEMVGGR